MSLDARLDELERRLAQIEEEWSKPEVAADPALSRKLGREQARIGPVDENYRALKAARASLESARHELQSESYPEFKELAKELIAESEAEVTRLNEELRIQLLPKDPNDDRDVIMEIRGGTGGEGQEVVEAGQAHRPRDETQRIRRQSSAKPPCPSPTDPKNP